MSEFQPNSNGSQDIQALEEHFLDWKETMRWMFVFQIKLLTEDPKADLTTFESFTKPPWYKGAAEKLTLLQMRWNYFSI